MTAPTPERVQRRAATQYVATPNGCWLATKARKHDGYVDYQWSIGGRVRFHVLAHRAAYEHHFGPIPDGLQVDHVCHDPATCAGGSDCPHRACVNPSHLRLASARENTLRAASIAAHNAGKTHCTKGHEFSETNTYVDRRGDRNCRQCHTERERIRRARRQSRKAS